MRACPANFVWSHFTRNSTTFYLSARKSLGSVPDRVWLQSLICPFHPAAPTVGGRMGGGATFLPLIILLSLLSLVPQVLFFHLKCGLFLSFPGSEGAGAGSVGQRGAHPLHEGLPHPLQEAEAGAGDGKRWKRRHWKEE